MKPSVCGLVKDVIPTLQLPLLARMKKPNLREGLGQELARFCPVPGVQAWKWPGIGRYRSHGPAPSGRISTWPDPRGTAGQLAMWGSSLPTVLIVPLTNIHAFTSGLLTDEELTTSHSLSLPAFPLELPLFLALFSASSFVN